MMKIVSIKSFSVLIVILSVISCSGIEKRKHRSGYHIEWREKNVFKTKKKQGELVESAKEVNAEVFKEDSEKRLAKSSPKRIIKTETKNNRLEIEEKSPQNWEVSRSSDISKKPKLPKKEKHKINSDESKEIEWMGVGLLASVLGAGLLALTRRKRLKKVSEWARENKNQAQLLIAGSSVLLPAISLSTGWLAGASDFNEVKFALLSAGVIGTGVSYYGKKGKRTYGFRKIREFIFAGMLMGLFHAGGNQLKQDFKQRETVVQVSDTNQVSLSHMVAEEINEDLALALRIFGKIGLTLLLLCASLFLLWLVLALSCTLACNGYGFVALMSALVGGVGVFFLFGLGLYHIWKKWKKSSKSRNSIEDERSKQKKVAFWENFMIGVFILLGTIAGIISLGL